MEMVLVNRAALLMLSSAVLLLVLHSVAASASIPSLSLPSLVPAFVWSNHRQLNPKLHSHLSTSMSISYETFSAEDFVKKVKGEFVRPEIESAQQEQEKDVKEGVDDLDLDLVMVFVGTKLRSGDVSRFAGGTRSGYLLQVLNRVVSTANSSASLPYVAPPRDRASFTNVLVREIVGEVEDTESRLGEVVLAGPCGIKNVPQTKRFSSLDALQEYLPGRMKTKVTGKTDLVVFCSSYNGESVGWQSMSEGEILDQLLWGFDEMNTRYAALYTTDLSGEKGFASKPRGRQLGSVVYEDEEYCDDVCKTKATILEGLFVGLTLLIILISGLCCMSGISTPVRFEQSKDGGQ